MQSSTEYGTKGWACEWPSLVGSYQYISEQWHSNSPSGDFPKEIGRGIYKDLCSGYSSAPLPKRK